jgi:hypothetical protein
MKTDKPSRAKRSLWQIALGLIVLTAASARAGHLQLSQPDIKEIRARLLELINTERALAGVSRLALDDLACAVADRHALDMVTGNFISHWGSDGNKPYHRYSLAGGVHAVQENVSALDGIVSSNPADLLKDVAYLHMRMHAETAPNDAHRRTILAPQHTHVGLGVAIRDGRLRLVEEYIARYVEVAPFKNQATGKAVQYLTVKLLNAGHALHSVEIFYEPLPTAPEKTWLRVMRPYALPADYTTLLPKLKGGRRYKDGMNGTIEFDKSERFRIPLRLFKDEPGIYTVVVWISGATFREPVPVTNICIRVN